MDLNDWAFGNPCHLNHPKQSVNHPKCGAHQKKHSGILHVPTKKSTDIWLSTHCVCEITRKKLWVSMKMRRQIPAKFIWDSPVKKCSQTCCHTSVDPWFSYNGSPTVSPWSESRLFVIVYMRLGQRQIARFLKTANISIGLSSISMGHGFQFAMLSNHRVRIPTKPPEKCSKPVVSVTNWLVKNGIPRWLWTSPINVSMVSHKNQPTIIHQYHIHKYMICI